MTAVRMVTLVAAAAGFLICAAFLFAVAGPDAALFAVSAPVLLAAVTGALLRVTDRIGGGSR
ncbi:hypothetical protein [Curtobacterium sp. MCBD17_040]|uniref:hypothetical protein n=1 Tax=Curtobacterium sp. MCBD17_040 TaxID=2175674 RepID=UPI000DA7BFAE|nr:hypothetical protein [Curtobacterium sp. MCBD17_040]WIB65404.1 hypothetical protein DEI94_18530 [Curtobacterium sp. MCBD17_040]